MEFPMSNNSNNLITGCFLVIVLLINACGVEVDTNDVNGQNFQSPEQESDWLIPENEIINGQGKDGIPSIDSPKFADIDQINFIPDDFLILGVRIGDEVRAYPLQIMDRHEIVNDTFGKGNVAVTYCPLTGTGIAWDRGSSEFGVSGLLFRNNLIPYDRSSNSRWSQMQLRAVNGHKIGVDVQLVDFVETTWGSWKQLFPESKVLTTETGYDNDYSNYAYPHTNTENGSANLFPVKNRDDRLNKMDKVHVLIASNSADEDAVVRAYEIEKFGNEIKVLNDTLNDASYVIAGSGTAKFTVSYAANIENKVLDFEAVQDSLPIIMKDEEGNRWDIFGRAVSGPRKGVKLNLAKSYTGYWFGIADFFPYPQLYKFNNNN